MAFCETFRLLLPQSALLGAERLHQPTLLPSAVPASRLQCPKGTLRLHLNYAMQYHDRRFSKVHQGIANIAPSCYAQGITSLFFPCTSLFARCCLLSLGCLFASVLQFCVFRLSCSLHTFGFACVCVCVRVYVQMHSFFTYYCQTQSYTQNSTKQPTNQTIHPSTATNSNDRPNVRSIDWQPRRTDNSQMANRPNYTYIQFIYLMG